MNEDLSGAELLEKWQDEHRCHHFENSTKNLNRIVEAIGYRDDMFGDALHNFLNDNPGAQEAIRDWIAEWIDRNREWKELILAEITQEPILDDEEEEE